MGHHGALWAAGSQTLECFSSTVRDVEWCFTSAIGVCCLVLHFIFHVYVIQAQCGKNAGKLQMNSAWEKKIKVKVKKVHIVACLLYWCRVSLPRFYILRPRRVSNPRPGGVSGPGRCSWLAHCTSQVSLLKSWNPLVNYILFALLNSIMSESRHSTGCILWCQLKMWPAVFQSACQLMRTYITFKYKIPIKCCGVGSFFYRLCRHLYRS